MGLDISFLREEAIQAGMVIGSDMEGEYIEVPNTDFIVDCGTDPETLWVRANRWGYVYAPLTKWLSENNILWEES